MIFRVKFAGQTVITLVASAESNQAGIAATSAEAAAAQIIL
jgi:hypothetical protein